MDEPCLEPMMTEQLESIPDAINRQRRMFASMRTKSLSTYLERQKQSTVTPTLVMLNGWGDSMVPVHKDHMPGHLLKESNDKRIRSGGYWLALGGAGIIINPGKDFLERFHAQGLHIWDIDHVIVTDGNENASSDIERIWTFNKEINALLREWQLTPHVISYWLQPQAFERSAPTMRPIFREERATVQRLETFPDISSFETVELCPTVSLDFCSATQSKASSSLMIRIKSNEENLGFLSQTSFEPLQTDFLSACSTLILGMGNTSFEEMTSLEPSKTTLGYSGVFNILQGASAHLALISEHGFSEGDIRIESLKHLRKELANKPITILPAEEGVRCFLDSLSMTASSLHTATAVSSVRSMRSNGPFSRLQFIDEGSIL
jgi:hypothetical protein